MACFWPRSGKQERSAQVPSFHATCGPDHHSRCAQMWAGSGPTLCCYLGIDLAPPSAPAFNILGRHPCLLVNNSNSSLLFPPDTFMVITFAGVYGKLYCVYLKQNSSAALMALCCCWTLNTIERS